MGTMKHNHSHSVFGSVHYKEVFYIEDFRIYSAYSDGNYMLIVNIRKTRTNCEICSKLTINIPDANAVVLEYANAVVPVSLLLTLNIFHILF